MKPKNKVSNFDIFRYETYLIIAIPLLVYISVIRLGFVYFDDDILILSNYEKLINIGNIGLAFRTDAFFSNLSPYYRPLMNISFMLDAIIGGKSPMIYHFSNLIYHILTCLSLYSLLQLLGLNKYKSLIGSVIFSVHPVMGHAVMWIPARGDILVTLFAIQSMIFLIKYLANKDRTFLFLHILCFSAALFSKESGVLLPLLFIFVIWLKKEKFISTNLLFPFLSWIAIIALWYYLRHITIDHRPDIQRGIYPLLQNLPFLPEAVSRLVFPFFLPVTPVFSKLVITSGLFIVGITIFYIFKNNTSTKLSLMVFGAIWFLGFCLPNMYVRLASATDSFEYLLHRIYLPGIGFLIFILSILPEQWFSLATKQYKLILAIILIAFISNDFYQQVKYKNAVNFWSSTISYAPQRSWFYYHYGRYYFMMKDLDNYEKFLLTADSLKSYPVFKYNLAMIYYTDRKEYEKAYGYFKTAFNQGYSDKEAQANFVLFCIESAYDFFMKKDFNRAIARCQIALNNDPTNAVAAYNMGIYLISKGNKREASVMWRRAITSNPQQKEAYKSLSLYYQYDVKNSDSAIYYANQYKKYGGSENILIVN